MNQPIELRKSRDFGQVINDSFTFFKENFKPLITALLIISGLFLVAETVANVASSLSMIDMYSSNTDNSQLFESHGISYIITSLINSLLVVLLQSFIHLTTLCYISVYLQKGNKQPTFAEVWGYFKYYFLRAIGSGFLLLILACVAFVAFIIPFIYLMPVFYLIIPIMIIENASFKYAYNKSFRLIKENWWFVFGVIFVMGLIVGMAAGIVSLPITIITAGSKFFSLKSFNVPVIIVFSILHSLITLAYSLHSVAVSMCYFTLTEQKEGLGLLDRIEKLGKPDNTDTGLPAEEY
jgi:hypothetical protein